MIWILIKKIIKGKGQNNISGEAGKNEPPFEKTFSWMMSGCCCMGCFFNTIIALVPFILIIIMALGAEKIGEAAAQVVSKVAGALGI